MTVDYGRLFLVSCCSLLTACAAGSIATESNKLNQPDENAKIQVPKSYPCQNVHVKTGNCPPR
jgi:hypothetical protein